MLTTYNPKSKWDWWVIGGRWSGALKACIEGKQYQNIPHMPAAFQDLPENGNIVPVKNLLNDDGTTKYSTFAVITPDGNWHERARMGWWAITSNEKKDWPEIYNKILHAHPR